MPESIECRRCDGTGITYNEIDSHVPCDDCGGTGMNPVYLISSEAVEQRMRNEDLVPASDECNCRACRGDVS